MKVSVLTLGCKVNQAESSVIAGNLIMHGFSVVSLSEQPEYCIVNTCSVTAKSDYQSRQLVRRAAKAGAKVIVTGCYAQLSPDDVRRIQGVIKVVENNNKYSIINMLTNNISSSRLCYSDRSRPSIKVQDGCNNACSYCIVPLARGRSKSIDIPTVINQVLTFESEGYHEVVLTGINLGTYGLDLTSGVNLSYLVKAILKETTIRRIRLSSLECNEIDDEIVELLQVDRLCNHVHLPLQSGNDRILNSMNRQYTSSEYVRTVEQIMRSVPGIALGTDVIAGFPGEGAKEFSQSKSFLDSIPFAYLHVFPFSPRPGTKAFSLPLRVHDSIKRERMKELNVLSSLKKQAYLKAQVNKILDIIIEETVSGEHSSGTSDNYLKVTVSGNGYPKKSLLSVRIIGTEGDTLIGIPINTP